MNKKIVHIGLDVDDTQYHGAALNKATGELFHFKCRLTLKGLLGQLTLRADPKRWISVTAPVAPSLSENPVLWIRWVEIAR
jgi:hypothetical protein